MVRPAGRIPFDLVSNDRVRNHGSAGADAKNQAKASTRTSATLLLVIG